ncbi:hypothetical protein KXD40_000542 [Peronospora effusa]|nr:hypothetical protein KXD40_000542 [Peronospora effusa]
MYANDNLAQSLWITFVTTGDKARAKQFEAMQKVLPSHYNDDDALIKDLVTDNGSHLAKRLLEMQMKIWTEDEKLLQMFPSFWISAWQNITFVMTGDKARAKQFEAMQKVLPSNYNDDDALIKDLVAR